MNAPSAAVHDRLLELGNDVAFANSEFRRAVRALGIGPVFAMVLFITTLVWMAITQKMGNK